MGEEHGLSPTETAYILKAVLASTRYPPTVSVHMFRRYFREAGMNRPIRTEAIRLYKKNKMMAEQIYQDFQNRKGNDPHKKTPLTAIEKWIAALKK
jgi:hypothetical protein